MGKNDINWKQVMAIVGFIIAFIVGVFTIAPIIKTPNDQPPSNETKKPKDDGNNTNKGNPDTAKSDTNIANNNSNTANKDKNTVKETTKTPEATIETGQKKTDPNNTSSSKKPEVIPKIPNTEALSPALSKAVSNATYNVSKFQNIEAIEFSGGVIDIKEKEVKKIQALQSLEQVKFLAQNEGNKKYIEWSNKFLKAIR